MIKDDSQLGLGYSAPSVVDHGDLRALTATTHLLLGASFRADGSAAQDLTFSGSPPPGPGGANPFAPEGSAPPTAPDAGGVAGTGDSGGANPGATDVAGDTGSGGVAGAGADSGADSPAGGAEGTDGGGGGSLPFTGFPALVIAGIGTGLAGAGAALRRIARRNRP